MADNDVDQIYFSWNKNTVHELNLPQQRWNVKDLARVWSGLMGLGLSVLSPVVGATRCLVLHKFKWKRRRNRNRRRFWVEFRLFQGRQARCEEGEGGVLDESKCTHISIFVVTIIIIVTAISITIMTIFVIGARTSIVQLSVHVARVCALNGRSA